MSTASFGAAIPPFQGCFSGKSRLNKGMSWDPALYLRFGDHRTRPAADLLARIPAGQPGRVIDLGCGPGNSTALLVERWPDAEVTGLDNSTDMLAQARASDIRANWISADLGHWRAQAPYDVIFSNAALQWLPDQETLLPRLMGFVAPGGAFAFQVPVNYDAPSHVLMREVAAEPRWREALAEVRTIERGTSGAYFEILKPHAAQLDIWQTEYLHVLEGEDAVFRWVSATGLRPFAQALQDEARRDFLETFRRRLRHAYPRRADGTTLFAFQRLFVVALKA
jgi:trans-aconitate 2-methyltransferase